ncbi:MAG: flagellar motor switch protein FliN [Nitrospina sp.]|nr:flagellar motor switch protein FliN [Nitrospina sp.]
MAEMDDDLDQLDDIDDVDADAAGDEDIPPVQSKDAQPEDVHNLDLILDIPLTVTVELGRSRMLINDLLQLGQGSVIELTKLVGEPLEVLVNQKLVARGEVVVVNEKFGVRLTDIVSPMERVQSLT